MTGKGSIALFVLMIGLVTGCGRPPDVPSDDAAVSEALTSPRGQDFLRHVSEYEWDDGGRSVAERLNWIAATAASSNPAVAERAGRSASAIVEFLAAERDSLLDIPTGIFGLQRTSVGRMNPALVSAYASSLIPYQGALIGDSGGVTGFTGGADSPQGELAAARDVVAVLNTNAEAGDAFRHASDERIKQYLRDWGRTVATSRLDGRTGLRHAAELAGVVGAGEPLSDSGNAQLKTAQYWINWAGYELALAKGVEEKGSDIPSRFFTPQGRLMSPDDVPDDDQDAFGTALENYAFHHGAPTFGAEFDGWYEDATGK